MVLQTEYEFNLPKGFVDNNGNLHKKGTMRLATAADEILPMKDPRVQKNPAYLSIIVLARAITRLGDLGEVTPAVIEKLFLADLTFLQEFYHRINGEGNIALNIKCPHCNETFEESLNATGE